ncbi:MAG TPA: hypothetical protein PKY77_03295 [Phycisphaerae bacterium]|nr:hypothetical protein [Phycisphaerae bacterium]HRY67375.1 hypothetical protein [Phycisphaerae bacterium]HSA29333.1 hypothetical protein [Phycisphaerae bacterium]
MGSPVQVENVLTCTSCGASVYPEHLQRGLAARVSGELFCPCCLAEKKKPEAAANADVPLQLVEESEVPERPSGQSSHGTTLHGTHAPGLADAVARGSRVFKRPLNQVEDGATRVRIFHAKLSDGAIRNMEQLVNEWLDSDPEVSIKFATTTVGTWEGKHIEPNLILTLYY